MNFDVISDIHLEFYKKEKNISDLLKTIIDLKKSSILCLLGDIGYPKQPIYRYFLEQMLQLYEYVLLLSGNHELYNNNATHDKMHGYIDKLCDELNLKSQHKIIYMQKKSIEINGYVFMGCTLWSSINNYLLIKNSMNDYKKIKKYGIKNGISRKLPITPTDTCNWHKDHLIWIEQQLELYKGEKKKVIVLTHHAPITDDDIHPNQYRKGPANEAYCTDLSYLLYEPIVCWCFGHTHQEYDKTHNGIILRNNPADYHLTKLSTMNKYFTVEL